MNCSNWSDPAKSYLILVNSPAAIDGEKKNFDFARADNMVLKAARP